MSASTPIVGQGPPAQHRGPTLPATTPVWLRAVVTIALPLLVYTAVGLVMFRGTQHLGMEFDEVFRVNNLVAVIHPDAEPYNQAISSIGVLGHSIPLMYKQYISSAFLVAFLPLVFFPDPLTGIRVLYVTYLILAASLAFLLFRDRAPWVAFLIPLLAMVSPLLYPDVTYGFADTQHYLPLIGAAWFVRRYIRTRRPWSLFAGGLLAGVAANVFFYSVWVLAAAAVAFVVVYPRVARSLVTSIRALLALFAGVAIGMFNYVYYNLTQGFPTLTPLINKIFFPARYAANPIDFRSNDAGVIAGLPTRLHYAGTLLGSSETFFITALALSFVVAAAGAVVLGRRRQLAAARPAFVPPIMLVIALGLILISPNTTRRGHYAVLVGLVAATLVAVFLLATRIGPRMRPAVYRTVAAALAATVFVVSAGVSRSATERVIASGGRGFFSSAVFDLWDYLVEHPVPDGAVLQVQWGTYAQFYFLSDGTYVSPSVVSQVLGGATPAAREDVVETALEASGGVALIPVYTDVIPTNGIDITKLLEDVAQKDNGQVCTVRTFDGRSGHEEIRLYRLSLDPPGGEASVDATAACPTG